MKPKLTKLKAWVDAKKHHEKLSGEHPVRSSEIVRCGNCKFRGDEVRYETERDGKWYLCTAYTMLVMDVSCRCGGDHFVPKAQAPNEKGQP